MCRYSEEWVRLFTWDKFGWKFQEAWIWYISLNYFVFFWLMSLLVEKWKRISSISRLLMMSTPHRKISWRGLVECCFKEDSKKKWEKIWTAPNLCHILFDYQLRFLPTPYESSICREKHEQKMYLVLDLTYKGNLYRYKTDKKK